MSSPKDNEITIQKEITPLLKQAQSLQISQLTMPAAVDMLSTLNKRLDQITEEKEKITKPLNEALKAERARWKPAEAMLEEAIATLRTNLTIYQTKQAQIEAKKKEAIATKVATGALSLDKASDKLNALPTAPKTTTTEAGAIQFRAVQKLKIINAELIPREYLFIDEATILKGLKNGRTIAGCELVTEQVPYNTR